MAESDSSPSPSQNRRPCGAGRSHKRGSTCGEARSLADTRPPTECELFRFDSQAEVSRWKTFADGAHGGLSTASLDLAPEGYAVLSGTLSTDLRDDAAGTHPVNTQARTLKRSGFCGMRVVADGELDLGHFDTMEYRVMGDGRKYIATLRTDDWIAVPGADDDLWQAFLFAPPGEWATVQIPFSRFVKTWRGRVVDTDTELNSRRVLSLGLSLAGGGALEAPGPYRLALKHIIARTRA